MGRKAFTYRRSVVCSSVEEVSEVLSTLDSRKVVAKANRPIIFMFTGQGSEYLDMGKQLYEQESVFRKELTRCFDISKQIMGVDLKDILYPEVDRTMAQDKLKQAQYAQPIIVAFEYALGKLLEEWGIQPQSMVGHGVGEYTAACLAGVLTLEDTLSLVALRGRLMQEMSDGKMDLEMMVAEFTDAIGKVKFNQPGIPYVSNLTGQYITVEECSDPEYWVRHLCETVEFAGGIGELVDGEEGVIVEAGPGRVLSTSVIQGGVARTVVNLVRHPNEDVPDHTYLLGKLGHLWQAGVKINWQGLHAGKERRRVSLPGYPFEVQHFPFDTSFLKAVASQLGRGGVSRGAVQPTSDRLKQHNAQVRWIVCSEDLAPQLMEQLKDAGQEVVTVSSGAAYEQVDEQTYTANPQSKENFEQLFKSLASNGLAEDVSKKTSIKSRPQTANQVEEILLKLWAETLGMKQITVDDDFFELGGDSLQGLVAISKIQQELGVTILLPDLFRTPTVKEMAKHIQSTVNNQSSKNLVKLKGGGEKNLFFIHPGSGEIHKFADFCSRSISNFNYWGINADRLASYAPENLTIEMVAGRYIEKIQQIQPHGPYFFAGWSAGGVIAFEMARQLEEMGEEVAFLGIIDSIAPTVERSKGQLFTTESELEVVRDHLPEPALLEELQKASDVSQFWGMLVNYLENDSVNQKLREKLFTGSFSRVIPDYELLGMKELIYYLNVIRTFDNALAEYRAVGKIQASIHLFKASQSDQVIIEQWKEFSDSMYSYEISGDHFSIFEMHEIDELVGSFDKVLDKYE